MTIDAARTLKNLLHAHGGQLTVFASVDSDSESFAMKGRPSFFTAALTQAANDLLEAGAPSTLPALGAAAARLLKKDGLSSHLQFLSEQSASIHLSDADFDPLLDYTQKVSDRQAESLEGRIELAKAKAAEGVCGVISDQSGNVLGHMFLRPEMAAKYDFIGCASILAIPAAVLLLSALVLQKFGNALVIGIVFASVVFIGALMTGRSGQERGFLFVTRDGLIRDDGRVIPWIDIADVTLERQTFAMKGATPKESQSVVVVDRHGDSIVLCQPMERWSMGKAEMCARIRKLRY